MKKYNYKHLTDEEAINYKREIFSCKTTPYAITLMVNLYFARLSTGFERFYLQLNATALIFCCI